MQLKDYYKIIGVAEDATADDIKKAYRKLAREHHPDLNKGDGSADRFKEVGEAYEVLKDPAKRKEYDEIRKYGRRQGEAFRPPPGQGAGPAGGGFDEADLEDFLQSIFRQRPAGNGAGGRAGGRAGPGGARFAIPGEDIHYRIGVTLEESYKGATRSLALQTHRFDEAGHVLPDTRTLNVRIPKGVVEGQRIRLKGQGGAGFGGAPNGDLYLEVELLPHPRFTVDGRDVSLALPVAPWEAGLGATVKVPTLGGPVSLAIKPGAQSGQRLRLAGRGLPGKPPGDQYVVLKIVMPKVAGDADRALLEQMQEQMSFDPRATLGV
ncbi:MAG: DnaJ domain-containing protein [Geminicoccaceae bacterium]|jgi:curved DNA-binding protein|nr:DnaJ domain-containing protein [Geminicoccaceae bacterium]HRY23875.1 DnaJ C-terminal domain-containing protein [Geminicoccaceae bacterium]